MVTSVSIAVTLSKSILKEESAILTPRNMIGMFCCGSVKKPNPAEAKAAADETKAAAEAKAAAEEKAAAKRK